MACRRSPTWSPPRPRRGIAGARAARMTPASSSTPRARRAFPKGAMHSQRSFVTCGEAFVQRMYVQPDDRLMIVLPLFHINALFYSRRRHARRAARAWSSCRGFRPSTFWQTAVDDRGDRGQHHRGDRHDPDAAPAQRISRPSTGSRKVYGVRQTRADTFRNEFGIPHLIGGYGMTEIPGVTCNPLEGPHKVGSMGPVGRHPDPGAAVGRNAASSTTTGAMCRGRGRRAGRQDADHHAGLFPRSRSRPTAHFATAGS